MKIIKKFWSFFIAWFSALLFLFVPRSLFEGRKDPYPPARKSRFPIWASSRPLAALLLVALTVAMSPTRVNAQLAAFTVPSWTNAIYSGLTTNVNNTGFRVPPGHSLSLVLEYKNHFALGTNGPLTFYFDASIDGGLKYTTTFPISFTTGNGVGVVTNREIFSLALTNGSLLKQITNLKLSKFSSVNTNVLTNVVITARPFNVVPPVSQ